MPIVERENDEAVELANAVLDALNDGEFSQVFEASRVYTLHTSLVDLKAHGLAVHVVALKTERERISRGTVKRTHTIGLAIAQKLTDTDDLATVDVMPLLANEFVDFFELPELKTLELENGDQATFIESSQDAPCVPDWLQHQRTFLCLVSLTYEVKE